VYPNDSGNRGQITAAGQMEKQPEKAAKYSPLFLVSPSAAQIRQNKEGK